MYASFPLQNIDQADLQCQMHLKWFDPSYGRPEMKTESIPTLTDFNRQSKVTKVDNHLY